MIHLFRPEVGWREAFAAAKVIHSRWLGEGPRAEEFRQRWAEWLGVSRVLTLASASDALCLSMEVLGVGPGDEVIIPSIHFVTAASAVIRRGAVPVFCDVNPHTLNTTPKLVAEKMTAKTQAILLLHYGGLPCPIEPMRQFGVPIVEDAAVAVGANIGGQACGTLGDMGLWSFDAMKTIGAGSGGAFWCRDSHALEWAELLIRLGITTQHGIDGVGSRWWEYQAKAPGRLSEMNDIAAAIALLQLEKLPRTMRRRWAVARAYDAAFVGLPLRVPPVTEVPTFYWIQTEKRDALARYLREKGIYTKMSYHPLHLAFKTGDSLPGAEEAGERTLLLPMHQALRKGEVKKVIQEVRNFYAA
jgi:dTDP-4-amino-4,6-dideoxygalactose transaminase